jgi:hypothetical protein
MTPVASDVPPYSGGGNCIVRYALVAVFNESTN